MSQNLKSTLTHEFSQKKQSDTYSGTYFDALYNDNNDPWQYQTRWYEKRKRDMCLAVLPQAEYVNAIELGCGNGVFSELLAHRCQNLLSIDGNYQAVQLAKQRLANFSGLKVLQGVIPSALYTLNESVQNAYPSLDNSNPSQPINLKYDLIVISEILYYLSLADIETVMTWVEQNLAVGGTLLCCHWRYEIEGFKMTGETVHQRLQQAFNQDHSAFNLQSQLIDSDFLLDVWQYSTQTVAMQENLV